jgi:hypothetical protein
MTAYASGTARILFLLPLAFLVVLTACGGGGGSGGSSGGGGGGATSGQALKGPFAIGSQILVTE